MTDTIDMTARWWQQYALDVHADLTIDDWRIDRIAQGWERMIRMVRDPSLYGLPATEPRTDTKVVSYGWACMSLAREGILPPHLHPDCPTELRGVIPALRLYGVQTDGIEWAHDPRSAAGTDQS